MIVRTYRVIRADGDADLPMYLRPRNNIFELRNDHTKVTLSMTTPT